MQIYFIFDKNFLLKKHLSKSLILIFSTYQTKYAVLNVKTNYIINNLSILFLKSIIKIIGDNNFSLFFGKIFLKAIFMNKKFDFTNFLIIIIKKIDINLKITSKTLSHLT